MSFAARDFVPLSFTDTLERLDSWQGHPVRVTSYSNRTQEPASHTLMSTEGVLGHVEMASDVGEGATVAGYSVGEQLASFSLSSADHVQTQPMVGGGIRIDFEGGYCVHVQRLD